MMPGNPTPRVNPAQMRELCEALGAEADGYTALLMLARRQGRAMRGQDLAGLVANAQEWQQALPTADAARIRRERLAAALMATTGEIAAGTTLSAWLPCLPERERRPVDLAVRRVRATVQALARENELNRRLAEFCLDLVEEEAAVFRDHVLADPAGRYDGAARRTQAGAGGVLVRQG